MPICPNCGVEIESERCPLCGSKPFDDENEKKEQPTAKKEVYDGIWFIELISFFSLAACLIVLAVNLAYGGNITWSRIPLISIIFTWLFIFLIHHLFSKPYLLVSLESLNFLVFLGLLDRFLSVKSWFISLALPIILLIGILFLLVILWIRSFRLSTLMSLAVGTLAAGIFLLCLEVILNKFVQSKFSISWSLVAFACILPVSAMFFYLNLRKKGSELKKYFHL